MTLDDSDRVSASDRLRRQLADLKHFYGLLVSPPADPFALFAWEVLAARTLPHARDAAFAALRRARILTPDSVTRAPRARLEAALAPAGGSIELRIEALVAGAAVFRRQRQLANSRGGSLFAVLRAFRELPKLDAAATHRLLLFAAGRPVLPVDQRVHRVGVRLGYGLGVFDRRSARSVRQALTRRLGQDLDAFRGAFVYLEHHGAVTCTERDPHCAVCPLLDDCPEGARRAVKRSVQ
jgi:endonuclease III